MKFISIDKLQPGMVIMKTIYDDRGKALLKRDRKLTATIIQRIKLLEYTGLYIYDDMEGNVEYREVISESLRIKAVRSLKSLNIDATIMYTNKIVDKIIDNCDEICIDLKDLRRHDDYTYQHSVNVAIVSVAIGLGLGLKDSELRDLAIGAMLHDLGKLAIPNEVLNKPGKLSDEEFNLIKMHPEFGYQLIKDNHSIKSVSKVCVLTHHENEDGSGYPLKKTGDKIHLYGKIVHAADVYDALTHQRSYKPAYKPSEAIEFMMAQAGVMFDTKVVESFLKYIVVYPIGTTVELSNNKEAIVVRNSRSFPLRPIVQYKGSNETLDLTDPSLLNITITNQKEEAYNIM